MYIAMNIEMILYGFYESMSHTFLLMDIEPDQPESSTWLRRGNSTVVAAEWLVGTRNEHGEGVQVAVEGEGSVRALGAKRNPTLTEPAKNPEGMD